jgi:hypothetical protein
MTARALSPISLIAITTCFLMNACASTGAPGKNTPPNSSADTTEVPPAPEAQPSDLPQAEQGYAQPPDGAESAPMAPSRDSAADKSPSYSGSQQSMPQPASAPRPAARSATAGAAMKAPPAMADESVASNVSRPRGEAKSSAPLRRDAERPGLATQWGETRSSWVTTTTFNRDGNQPWSVLRIQYDDESGIMARTGRRSYSELLTNIAETSNGYVSVQIVDGSGNALAGLTQGARSFVVGHAGDRYSIRVMNHSSERFEVLATVDGLDVIDGRVASYSKRGYLIDAYGTLDIDGFRRSSDAVAAFRFGSVRDSYAARTGSDRNVGVIGVAIFRERDIVDERRWEENHRRDNADPFPNRYSTPPTPVPMIRN